MKFKPSFKPQNELSIDDKFLRMNGRVIDGYHATFLYGPHDTRFHGYVYRAPPSSRLLFSEFVITPIKRENWNSLNILNHYITGFRLEWVWNFEIDDPDFDKPKRVLPPKWF